MSQPIDKAEWQTSYRYAIMDLAVNHAALYMMAHTFRHYAFMERVVLTGQARPHGDEPRQG